MTAPRFEVVRSDATQPWHARFRAANGRIVWTTETYRSRSAAKNAVVAIAAEFSWGCVASIRDGAVRFDHGGFGDSIEVRYVDERVTSDA